MVRQNIIYKIYFSNKCVFIGWADSNLTNILRVLFFGTKDQQGMDITRVSKIEYAVLPSKADCFIYQTYLVNKLKPLYNKTFKARDSISSDIVLPELNFLTYNDPVMDKWRKQVEQDQLSLFIDFNFEGR